MKQLFLVMILFTVISLQAQPFLSVAATTKGEGLSIGYLEPHSGIELSTGYNVHLYREDVPAIFNLSLGKRTLLSHQDKDNFTITPSIGYAVYSVKDFTNFEKDEVHGEIIQIRLIRPIYGLELGKDWYLGRLYINANYCNKSFFGIGMRVFIK